MNGLSLCLHQANTNSDYSLKSLPDDAQQGINMQNQIYRLENGGSSRQTVENDNGNYRTERSVNTIPKRKRKSSFVLQAHQGVDEDRWGPYTDPPAGVEDDSYADSHDGCLTSGQQLRQCSGRAETLMIGHSLQVPYSERQTCSVVTPFVTGKGVQGASQECRTSKGDLDIMNVEQVEDSE